MFIFFIACSQVDKDNTIQDVPEETPVVSPEDSNVSLGDYDIGVHTFVGSGEPIIQDGVQNDASLIQPRYITFASGMIYLSESNTNTVRRISLEGEVETLTFGGQNVTDPAGIAVNEQGDIFLVDSSQHCIVQISNSNASIFAGTCGEYGFEDGSSGLFYNPKDIIFDHDGNLIVADAGNSRIRSISPQGTVSTIAGKEGFGTIDDGVATDIITYMPYGLAIDDAGGIYFSGLDNCIRYLYDNTVETVAGFCQNYSNSGENDGISEEASFNTPMAIALGHQNELYISDSLNHRIRVLSEDGEEVSTLSGSTAGYMDGTLGEGMFYTPRGLVFIDDALLVVDSDNHRIRLVQQ